MKVTLEGNIIYRIVFLTGVTKGEDLEEIQIELEVQKGSEWTSIGSFFVTKDFFRGIADLD